MTQEIFNKKNTLYGWCLANNIRILDMPESKQDSYMLDEIDSDEFVNIIDGYKIKDNATPIKPDKFLELRMYGLVPYNLSEIQKGIQFNHANDAYSLEWGKDNQQYDWFRTEWKTNILLNGGTSNEGHNIRHGFNNIWYVGSMQNHLSELKSNDIKVSTFYEPDLNSMLTSIVFLVDERVFNKTLYPNFKPHKKPDFTLYVDKVNEYLDDMAIWEKRNTISYNEWLNFIGGPKNEFLRRFLENKKLA